jgi:cytochrome c
VTSRVRFTLAAGIVAAGWVLAFSVPGARASSSAAVTAASGEALFRKRACAVCHSLVPGKNLNGPSLAGVYGRAIGAAPGYAYSSGLSATKGKWDAKRLDAWLADPRGMVAATKMAVKVPSPQERAAIIAYLKTRPVK